MLQVELQVAFDTVTHNWLVYTRLTLKLPVWFCGWVQNYLTDRTTTLTFDGRDAGRRHVLARVPHGSPLSPTLFVLFTTPLSDSLETKKVLSE